MDRQARARAPDRDLSMVTMDLPEPGEKNVLALQRSVQGGWVCTSAAKVTVPDSKLLPLDEKYLPAACHGDGSALGAAVAASPAGCPPGQEMVTLTTSGISSSACTPQCPAGQTRDTANPTLCNSPALAVAIATATAANTPAVAPAAASQPAAAAATPATPVTTPTAKAAAAAATPTAAATAQPAAQASVTAGTARLPGAAGDAPIKPRFLGNSKYTVSDGTDGRIASLPFVYVASHTALRVPRTASRQHRHKTVHQLFPHP